jgi:hypothetical protein
MAGTERLQRLGWLPIALLLVSPANALAGQHELRVRIRNQAAISENVLRDAQTRVERVFGAAGIQIHWINLAESDERGAAMPLIVTVLPDMPTALRKLSSQALGYTPLAHPADLWESAILASRVFQIAQATGITKQVVLGAAIAHELGHLLLQTSTHSASGIMHASFARSDLESAARDGLLFLPEQARRLRASIEADLQR